MTRLWVVAMLLVAAGACTRSSGGMAPVDWEGGPAYYAAFPAASAAGWTSPDFFPVGVWYESLQSPGDVALDRAAGLNTYVELTGNSDLSLLAGTGMSALVTRRPGAGAETVGWLLNDEVDMWAGPGRGAWSGRYPGQGDICSPAASRCGYTVLDTLAAELPTGDGRLRYANFGKGVMFWQSDAEAAGFVNGYTSAVSADVYWYTDPNVCRSASEGPRRGVDATTCRRAANYGLTMDRVRALDAADGSRQPVWAFVEVGHPFSEADAPTVTGAQVAGAVVNSLIHQARGIVYFNHSFGGPCQTQHVLRDACGDAVRPAVTAVNRLIADLAPVLNTRSYAWRFNPRLDTMLKAHGGAHYVFAMPGRTGGTGRQRLVLPPALAGAGEVEVLNESRRLPVSGGAFSDTFDAEHSYHVYRITA